MENVGLWGNIILATTKCFSLLSYWSFKLVVAKANVPCATRWLVDWIPTDYRPGSFRACCGSLLWLSVPHIWSFTQLLPTSFPKWAISWLNISIYGAKYFSFVETKMRVNIGPLLLTESLSLECAHQKKRTKPIQWHCGVFACDNRANILPRMLTIVKTGNISKTTVLPAQSFTLALVKFQFVFWRVDTAVVFVVAVGGGGWAPRLWLLVQG